MKKLLYIVAFVSLAFVNRAAAQVVIQGGYQSGGNITYQTFYNELQPYGNWISYPGYGYVWQPAMGNGFRPYETNGHWVSTVDGWAWASDYNWGWAPFHYGRWLLDPAIGWVWVPGYEWAPAWVQWGRRSNYYGWAPLSPGISISIGSSYIPPAGYWSFIPYNCINRPHINRYVVRNNVTVSNITVINNYHSYNNKVYYHRGPEYKEVQNYTHTTIKPLPITAASSPGRTKVANRLEVYRPQVATENVNNIIVPKKVKTVEEVKTERQSAGIKSPNTIQPVKQNTAIKANDNNGIIQQNNPQPVRQTTRENNTRLQNPNVITSEQVKPQQPSRPANVIKSEAEENAGQVKPAPGNNIKLPPGQTIETPLPEPKRNDQFQHRDEPGDRPVNRQNNVAPPPAPKAIPQQQAPVQPGKPVMRQPEMQAPKPAQVRPAPQRPAFKQPAPVINTPGQNRGHQAMGRRRRS